MATADLISSFLSNEMSPDRERQFLLSVAASDSLRLELKSHMVLDRVLLGRAQRARVPDAVRQAIFTEAGASDGSSARPISTGPVSVSSRRGFLSRWGGRIATILAAFTCFGAGYYAGELGTPAATSRASSLSPAVPRTTAPAAGARVATPTTSATEPNAAPVSTSGSEQRTAARVASTQRNPVRGGTASTVRSDNTPSVTAPTAPAGTDKGDRSLMDRPGRDPQTVGFDQTIDKPSDKDRQIQNEQK